MLSYAVTEYQYGKLVLHERVDEGVLPDALETRVPLLELGPAVAPVDVEDQLPVLVPRLGGLTVQPTAFQTW